MDRRESLLELSCRGCGAVLALDDAVPLVPSVRPFVEQHRLCPGSADVDREMRSAYSHPR